MSCRSDSSDHLALSFVDVLSCALGSGVFLFMIFSVMPHLGGDSPSKYQRDDSSRGEFDMTLDMELEDTRVLTPVTVHVEVSGTRIQPNIQAPIVHLSGLELASPCGWDIQGGEEHSPWLCDSIPYPFPKLRDERVEVRVHGTDASTMSNAQVKVRVRFGNLCQEKVTKTEGGSKPLHIPLQFTNEIRQWFVGGESEPCQ